MGSRVTEANMDALNRSFERMDMESRRSSARVESHDRRGLGSRHHEDRGRYDDDYTDSRRYEDYYPNPRDQSTRGEPRRRRGMESHHLDNMDDYVEEDIYPRKSSTRGVPRKSLDDRYRYNDYPTDPRDRSTRGEPRRRREMETRHLDDMNEFDEDFYPRESSTRRVSRKSLDDRYRYNEAYTSPRHPSTQDELRRRREMETHHLDDLNDFDEEDIYPRESSTRRASRKRRDTGLEAIDRQSPDNFPHALGGGHGSRSRTTGPCLPLPHILAELDEAEGDEESGKEAMRQSRKGSNDYNQGREKRKRAKLRIKRAKTEAYKHDPKKHDMDEVERLARFLSSRDERHDLVGTLSRSHRGPTPTRTGDHGRREHTAGRDRGHNRRHGHGGRPRRSDFY